MTDQPLEIKNGHQRNMRWPSIAKLVGLGGSLALAAVLGPLLAREDRVADQRE